MISEDNSLCAVIGIGTCTDTDVVIPSSYNGLPVTGIGDRAFFGCTSLTNVTFAGTKAEWAAITLYPAWGEGVPFTVVHCSDGNVTVEG